MKNEKFFYGWIIVAAGFMIGGASTGILNNCNSIFVKPVTESMGFLRSEFTMYPTIASLVSMLVLPIYGELYSRCNLKKLMLVCGTICSLAPFGYAFCQKIWQFYAIALIFGLAISGVSLSAVGVLLNNWFRDKKGLAMGIAFSGSGLFGSLMIPVVSYFIERFGWRTGYLALGVASLCIMIPVVLFMVKVKPAEIGLEPYTEVHQTAEATVTAKMGVYRHEAIKSSCFWYLAIASFSYGLIIMGIHMHAVPYLTDIGFTPAFASTIASVLMLLLLFSKMLLGYLFDKLGALGGSMLGAFGGFLAVIFIYLIRVQSAFVWGYLLTCAVSCAVGSVATSYLVGNYFGDLDYGRILPWASMAVTLGCAIGNPMAGAIYDFTGSYDLEWGISFVLGIICIVCYYLAYRSSKKIEFHEEF